MMTHIIQLEEMPMSIE